MLVLFDWLASLVQGGQHGHFIWTNRLYLALYNGSSLVFASALVAALCVLKVSSIYQLKVALVRTLASFVHVSFFSQGSQQGSRCPTSRAATARGPIARGPRARGTTKISRSRSLQ